MSHGSANTTTSLQSARSAYDRGAWRVAYEELAAIAAESPLPPEDLERRAVAAEMIGRPEETGELLARAHQEYLSLGRAEDGARCAFWLGFRLLMSGEPARGSGWLARCRRVLDEAGGDSVVRGYLLVPQAIRTIGEKPELALALFEQAVAAGERFRDAQLVAMARQGMGRALIRLGRIAEGVALLDEVMVAVTAGEVSPITIGGLYCSLLDACHEIFDLRRAHEWTTALEAWCAAQPDVAPYRGQCLIRRSELMQLHGAWGEAMADAERACTFLSGAVHPAVGAAFYQLGEVHRLRGELAAAERAYSQANQAGRQPQPGLALLRLQQRRPELAAAAIRSVADEAREPRERSRLLAAYVEIMLAVGDVQAARAAADELVSIAASFDAPYLYAAAAECTGAVALAEGDPERALSSINRAWRTWCELEAPYEAARACVLLALAHRALGDEDTSRMELESARQGFAGLGATPDVRRVDELARGPRSAGGTTLTSRELQVLRLIATGRTNRAIAARLGISEKTVARHVSNLFAKLGLSSRAAATAYAYEHQLVTRPST